MLGRARSWPFPCVCLPSLFTSGGKTAWSISSKLSWCLDPSGGQMVFLGGAMHAARAAGHQRHLCTKVVRAPTVHMLSRKKIKLYGMIGT